MSKAASEGCVELSIVLPTDEAGTIEPVLRNLERQTIASKIEVVLVVAAKQGDPRPPAASSFADVRRVQVEKLSPLGRARAAGVRAAAAPFVFIGETHSFLRPDAAEKLLERARAEDCAVVVPGFENQNPSNLWSWAAFLGDYGAWSAAQAAVEVREPPVYNALIRRVDLLALQDGLDEALYHGDQLRRALSRGGARTVFEPAARIGHVNIDQLRYLWREHFMVGHMIGARRAREWSLLRRAFYFLAGPMIPFVLLARAFPGIRATLTAVPHRLRTLGAIFALKSIRAVGEMVGYLGVPATGLEARADRLEIRKFDYVSDPALAQKI